MSTKSSSSPALSSSTTLRRTIRSCLLGGAIGDALGMPLEQLPETIVRENFTIPIEHYNDPVEGAPCYRFGLKKGMYTDDTQAVRASAREIAKHGSLSPTIIANALSGWLFHNSLDQAPRYPGVTTLEAMSRYEKTKDALECGVLSGTCGAAIRIAPVALWLSLTRTVNFEQEIVAAAEVTHTDKSAVDGARLVAHLIRTGLLGITPSMGELLTMCSSDLMRKAVATADSAITRRRSSAELALEIGGGTKAHEVVPMALFHMYSCGFDFRTTLTSGLNTFHPSGLDMDSILSISGSVCGVRQIKEVETSEWLPNLEDYQLIASDADGLFFAGTASSRDQ